MDFFLIAGNDPQRIVALVRHQVLFETIIDFAIVSLNVVERHIQATQTNSLKYTKFHGMRSISIRSSTGKALGCDSTANLFRLSSAF